MCLPAAIAWRTRAGRSPVAAQSMKMSSEPDKASAKFVLHRRPPCAVARADNRSTFLPTSKRSGTNRSPFRNLRPPSAAIARRFAMCCVVPMRPVAPLMITPIRRSAIAVSLLIGAVARERSAGLCGMRLRPIDNLGVGCKPNTPFGFRVPNKLIENPDARTVANHMRMAGELEDAAIVPSRIQFAAENVEHICRRRIGPERGKAVHHKIDGIVAHPLHRQLDDTRRLAIEKQFVAVLVCHQGGVIGEPEFLLDAQRVGTKIP